MDNKIKNILQRALKIFFLLQQHDNSRLIRIFIFMGITSK